MYSSALHNSSRQFTPVSLMYLLLLAFNYAIMPRLSKKYIHPKIDKRSVALAEEVVKMGIGFAGWIITHWVVATDCTLRDDDQTCYVEGHATPIQLTCDAISKQLSQWSPQSTLLAAGIPSLLYAIQGTLTYTAYQHLDSVTFNGLTQFKVLSSALGCYIILGQTLSRIQTGNLALLMVSTLVFQGNWKELWDRLCHSLGFQIDDNSKDCKKGNRNHFLLGVLPCLCATMLSGLAGALSQKSLQSQVGSMMDRDAYFYTIEISFLSAVYLLVSLLVQSWKGSNAETYGSMNRSFFANWDYTTLVPIITKATAGVLTALVHRHLGSVIKGFALVLGLVFSALLQFVLEGNDLTTEQLVGTAFVLLSSWLHFTNPAK